MILIGFFLSERAEFASDKAIRGGVPVCFPQFAGQRPYIKHGFARISRWKLLNTRQLENSSQAVFQLEDSNETFALWPHAFRITLTVSIEASFLALAFKVENTGTKAFHFTGALHTYLRVQDINNTVIENLEGYHYRDSVTGIQDKVQHGNDLRIINEVNRIYEQAPSEVVVREPDRSMNIQTSGFTDVVIWNPGPAKCAMFNDMHPEIYRHMLCVEAAVISTALEIMPGDSWFGTQTLYAQ